MEFFTRADLLRDATPPYPNESDVEKFGATLDRLTRAKALRPVHAGGGRGKHRRYDLTEASLAAIGIYLAGVGLLSPVIEMVLGHLRMREEDYGDTGIQPALNDSHVERGEPVELELNWWPMGDDWRIRPQDTSGFGEPGDCGVKLTLDLVFILGGIRGELAERRELAAGNIGD
jgi:hypothetical protein